MRYSLSTNIENKIEKLLQIKAAFEEVVGITCEAIADYGIVQLETLAPYDDAPNNMTPPGEEGHLNESFYATSAIYSDAFHARVTVKTDEPIKFGYVTEGTDTPILPRAKKAMWWPDAPHPMYAVSGQEPNDFAEIAHGNTMDAMPGIVQNEVKAILIMIRDL